MITDSYAAGATTATVELSTLKTVPYSELKHPRIRQRRTEISERTAIGNAVARKIKLHRPDVEARGVREVERLGTKTQRLTFREIPAFAHGRIDVECPWAAQVVPLS